MITLLTDFGRRDPYVGLMEAVIARIAPAERVVHLTHDLPPQDVGAAGFWLHKSVPYFPADTVHLAVVDPGVGTERRAVAVTIDQTRFIAPDNGLLAPLLHQAHASGAHVQCRELDITRLTGEAPTPVGHTFHGRDLFSPAAALWARDGHLDERSRPLDPQLLILPEAPAPGRVEIVVVDHFGNLITDHDIAEGERAEVRLAPDEPPLPWVRTYGETKPGTLVALRGSFGTLELAVVQGSAQQLTGLGRGAVIHVVYRALQ